MGYLRNFFVAIDQLGNALAGGDPDSTISARVGYFANYDSTTKDVWYWNMFQFIINTTFYPVDGKNHCLQAYYYDPGENYRGQGFPVLYLLAAVIIVSTCIPIAAILWLIYLFGMRPKPYQSIDNIWEQTITIQREIIGLEREFVQQATQINGQIDTSEKSMAAVCEALDYVIKNATDFKEKIIENKQS